MSKKTTILMILDGFGLSDRDLAEGDAIRLANTPALDELAARWPFAAGHASGVHVGLPADQMGNSEVGHLNIGAGRIVYQELTRITKSIADGDFFANEGLIRAIDNCKRNGTALHLMGLLSDGGVHSHIEHLYALLRLAADNGLTEVYVHAFLDGRDTPPTSGRGYLAALETKMREVGVGQIATVMGRYYAMDRDNRWERTERAYRALATGGGERAPSADDCIARCYAKGETDEFITPAVIGKNGPTAAIQAKDSVIFFNFRPDRARALTRAFCDPAFAAFERRFFPLVYVCMTAYDPTIPGAAVAFKPQTLTDTLGETVAKYGLTQLRLAETEKYAHVTFFLNGGVETPNPGEDRILIPSPKAATYDLQPEMSAHAVTDALVDNIRGGAYNLIIVNYANCDMVGHTGVLAAAIQAVETVDACVGRVVQAVYETGAQLFICADHGNADKMIDHRGINSETTQPFTAHTTSPVPFIAVNCSGVTGLRAGGKLCDIAPTVLDLMGIPKPAVMTGQSLLLHV